MAVSKSSCFHSEPRSQPRAAHPSYALPEEFGRELRALFCELPSASGLRSVQGGFEASCWGLRGSQTHDPHAALHELVSGPVAQRARVAHRSLLRMDAAGQGQLIVVLYRMNGDRNAQSERPEFGALAPIADLTDEVERAREEIALLAGERRERRVSDSFADGAAAERKLAIETEFWWVAGRALRAEARMEKQGDVYVKRTAAADRAALTLARTPPVVDLETGELLPEKKVATRRRREEDASRAETTRKRTELRKGDAERTVDAWYTVLASLLEAFEYDGELGARLSALASEDRATTPAEAITKKLAAYAGPREVGTGKVNKEAFAAWQAHRAAFISAVVSEASAIYRTAGEAYAAARASTR